MENIAAEVLWLVLEQLSADTLVKIRGVCTRWKQVSERLLSTDRYWAMELVWDSYPRLRLEGRRFSMSFFPVTEQLLGIIRPYFKTVKSNSAGILTNSRTGTKEFLIWRDSVVICPFVRSNIRASETGDYKHRRHIPCYETGVCLCAYNSRGDIPVERPYSWVLENQMAKCCCRSYREDESVSGKVCSQFGDILEEIGMFPELMLAQSQQESFVHMSVEEYLSGNLDFL